METAHPVETASGLRQRAIGLPEVLFQGITSMAPAGAVAFSIAIGAAYAGGALTLSVILALAACLTVAVSIGQLAQHLPSAGSFYTYPAHGLHPAVGFLAGWGYALAESLFGPVTALIFGSQVAGQIVSSGTGTTYEVWWIVFLVLPAIASMLLNYFGIRVSTEAGIVLGATEIIIFTLLAIWLIVEAGSRNTLSPFTTQLATVEHFVGISGVFAGAVYTMLAFLGFEATTPLAEETKHPGRDVKLAAFYSALGIGLFYVFTTYAGTVYFGVHKFSSFAQFGGGSPWVQLAKDVWGVFWILAFLAILNSTFGNENAATAAISRLWYAMARIRLFPSALAHIQPERRVPDTAIFAQFVWTLIVGIGLGLKFGPVNGFILGATIITAIVIMIYMVINLSSIFYFLREQRGEFNWFLHGLVPIVGVLFLIPVLLASLGIGSQVLSFVSPPPYPTSLTGPVVAIWFAAGIIYLIYLAVRHPVRLRETRQVFVEEPNTMETAPAPATPAS